MERPMARFQNKPDTSDVQGEQAPSALSLARGKQSTAVHATRVRGEFIEFEFAVNDPTLMVELIMPPEMFWSFSLRQEARVSLTPEVSDFFRRRSTTVPAAYVGLTTSS